MIHAVIDTNVLVSALLTSKSDTATVQVLEAIMNGQIIPLYNEEIISEYEIVLNRPTFNFTTLLRKKVFCLLEMKVMKSIRIRMMQCFMK